ncbi:hypothetical protein pEaSNUABM14_00159 [Erwinia phage pEa_SNUABM_14]|nr:hypothetical protein pEaSNUABM34_00158 [Erwinia phage pEa_SNUABM_34]QYW03802.1 hypothetical protein pEaSNUABM45_00159 [Erwinia phage pEa_SNUABM_45]QYW04143.1 hypothetical protein pEaSNUABM46_00159 [Erwinia phage pEa_SNUABM_46]QYW04484.1 hypothetical protein pEaSNUABM14_00159 [Erwinia phage pEa_SNUABM_14]
MAIQHTNVTKLIGLEALTRDLVAKLITSGFALVAVDGKAGTTVTPTGKSFYLLASASVDPLYTSQKWGIILTADNANKQMSVNVLPDLQVDAEDYTAAMRSATVQVGRMAKSGLLTSFFIDQIADWKMDAAADITAYPLTYDLVVTDHGVALHVNAEGFDNTGTAFSWFVVQRGVQEGDTKPGDQSPLFAVFSCGGGLAGDPDTLKPESIQRYVVIENGIYAATVPVSAVQASADCGPIINPMQQVMIAEGNRAIVLFPQMINTQRYVYFATLDMLGYTSADVLSSGSQVQLNPLKAADKTVYQGMNANGKDNRGMRLMLPVAAGDSA